MKKSVLVLLGVAAGAAVAALVSTKRGKQLGARVSKKVGQLKDGVVANLEKKSKDLGSTTNIFI